MSSDPWRKLSLSLFNFFSCLLFSLTYSQLWVSMTLYKAWSHPFLSIVGGVGRKKEKRKVLISRCTTSGQHLSSIWTKQMKGERNSYWWEENRWQSTEASLRPASGLCSPLFAVLQGLYSTLPPRFQGIDSLAGNPSPAPGRISHGLYGLSIPQPGRECQRTERTKQGQDSRRWITWLPPMVPRGQAWPVSL